MRLPLLPCWALLTVFGGCAGESTPPRVVLEPTIITFADLDSQDVRFVSPADRPVLITIEGQGIDVRAGIVHGDSLAIAYADAPNRRLGVETLLVEAPHDPEVVVRIERNDNAGVQGRVRAEAIALDTVTDRDRRRLSAAQREAAGCLAFPDPANGTPSVQAFEAAARDHEASGNRHAAGRALLQAAGARYARLSDWRGAADLSARAGRLLDGADSAALAAFALRLEGAALDQHANAIESGDSSRKKLLGLARERLTQAAARFRSLGNDYEAAYALNYRGVSYQVTGERSQAAHDFHAALRHFTAAGDMPGRALSLQSLGVLAYEDGRTGDALRELDRALALIPRQTDAANYAHTLHNSAVMHRMLGRYDEAMARYFESGEILRQLGDRDGEARALHGLGTTLLSVGEPERAAGLLREAIGLRQKTGARREQAVSLLSLGQLEREAGRPASAIALDRQALDLMSAPIDRAMALLALARDERAAGRPADAGRRLEELLALPLPGTNRSLGLALGELASIEWERGRRAAALGHFERAIRIQQANGSDVDHARTLSLRAQAELRTGEMAGALADSAAALARFEAAGLLSLPPEQRAAFRASYRDAVELRIAALLRAADLAAGKGDTGAANRERQTALATSDQARAQLLVDPAAHTAASVTPEWLAERERAYELLAGKRQQRERLLESAAPDAARIAGLSREIERLRTRAQLIDGRIGNAAGAPLTAESGAGPDPLRAAPRDVLVAEYFLGATHAWLFAVRNGSVTVHELPAPAGIERLARELHGSWRQAARGTGDRLPQGRRLARILYGPLGAETPAGGLRIVPDGALHLVPMAVLARQAWPELDPGSALIVPSASEGGNGTETSPPRPDLTLAVIADPVYTADDARIRHAAVPAAGPATVALTRGARDLEAMRRLPATGTEARELLALVDDSGQTLALIGPQANRAQVVAAPLARYRIVHFATHALADSEDPALATLALSRWNAAGQPVNGVLRAYDVARLRLNADLVVLSGCDTALGREIAGEGPVGLSQAFLRSGARAVVATLWQVPDTSTAILMRAFYRRLLVDGLDAPVALQLAQDELRREPRWSDPYFWAGFQLVSNARPPVGNNNDVKSRKEP